MGTPKLDKGDIEPITRLALSRCLQIILFLAVIGSAILSAPALAQVGVRRAEPEGMKTYASPYYVVHSDLDEDRTNEALLRMTRMAEEYHERTKEFSGVIRTKFPFFLFKHEEDYYAAGALPGSAGVFIVDGNGARLMAIAGDETKRFTWHVVQHEGFHQFAHAVIGGELPPWLNEGLAEYFGEGLFTGDGFVTGLLPSNRVREIQAEISHKAFPSMQNMMLMTPDGWNGRLLHTNYDMAWSMAHFLAHGDDGKYQTAFAAFVKDIGRNINWQKAWQARFGSAEGFEKRWSAWWLGLDPDTASKQLYLKATVQMLTSILGRASMQKQTFDNWEEFLSAVKAQTVKISRDDWLPPSLLESAAELAQKAGSGIKFEIGRDAKVPQVAAILEDGTRMVGIFNPRIQSGIGKVTVTIDDMTPKLAAVKALLEEGKKAEAKAILLQAIKRNPTSPLIAEARKLLPKTN